MAATIEVLLHLFILRDSRPVRSESNQLRIHQVVTLR